MSISRWRVVQERIWRRDDWTCTYCGGRVRPYEHFGGRHPLVANVDHVRPVSEGGETDDANLVTACTACNTRKGNRPLSVFLRRLHRDWELEDETRL